jgi:hypothetical protein
MRIKKLKLITETDTYYIFEITYKSFFGAEKNRTAIKNKWESYPKWMDTDELIISNEGINAWLSTDKKDFIL